MNQLHNNQHCLPAYLFNATGIYLISSQLEGSYVLSTVMSTFQRLSANFILLNISYCFSQGVASLVIDYSFLATLSYIYHWNSDIYS